MLAKARGHEVYDELAQMELTEFLQGRLDTYDLIACVDTLVYFGDLERVLCASAAALRPGGRLGFSVEKAVSADPGFRINMRGRYEHAEEYIRQALEKAGLQLRSLEVATLRTECAQPVTGMIVVARRGEGSNEA